MIYVLTTILISLAIFSLGENFANPLVFCAAGAAGMYTSYWQKKTRPVANLKTIANIGILIIAGISLMSFLNEKEHEILKVLINGWVYILITYSFIHYEKRDFYITHVLSLGLVLFSCAYSTNTAQTNLVIVIIFLGGWTLSLRKINLFTDERTKLATYKATFDFQREFVFSLLLFVIVTAVAVPIYLLMPRFKISAPVMILRDQQHSRQYVDYPRDNLMNFFTKSRFKFSQEPFKSDNSQTLDNPKEMMLEPRKDVKKPEFWHGMEPTPEESEQDYKTQKPKDQTEPLPKSNEQQPQPQPQPQENQQQEEQKPEPKPEQKPGESNKEQAGGSQDQGQEKNEGSLAAMAGPDKRSGGAGERPESGAGEGQPDKSKGAGGIGQDKSPGAGEQPGFKQKGQEQDKKQQEKGLDKNKEKGPGDNESEGGISLLEIILFLLLILALILLLLAILSVFLPYIREKRKIKQAEKENDYHTYLILIYKFLSRILSLFGLRYPIIIDPKEQAARAAEKLSVSALDFSSMTTIFVEARYSHHVSTLLQKQKALECYRSVLEDLKKNSPVWTRNLLYMGFLFDL